MRQLMETNVFSTGNYIVKKNGKQEGQRGSPEEHCRSLLQTCVSVSVLETRCCL